MKVVGTVKDLNCIKDLKKRCDGVVVRHQDYSLRYEKTRSINQIIELVNESIKAKLTVFLDVTAIFDDEGIKKVKKYINNFLEYNIFYIFGDMGMYSILNEFNLLKKSIYAPDTYISNYMDFNFFKKYKLFGVIPSMEIPVHDIALIGNNKKLKMFYKGFGHIPMFQSKRPLVSLYAEYFNIELDAKKSKNLKLIEETRQEEYKIVENNHGTTIYQYGVHNVLPVLDSLCDVVDIFFLDGIFLEREKYLKAIDIYKEALCDIDRLNYYNDQLDEVFNNLSYNFVYEDTVYKKGEL